MTGGHDDRQASREARRWEGAPATAAEVGIRRREEGSAPAVTPPGTHRRRIRWHGVALLVSAVTLVLGVTSQVAGATIGAAHDVMAPGPARFENVVAALSGAAMLGLLLWIALALTSSAVI